MNASDVSDVAASDMTVSIFVDAKERTVVMRFNLPLGPIYSVISASQAKDVAERLFDAATELENTPEFVDEDFSTCAYYGSRPDVMSEEEAAGLFALGRNYDIETTIGRSPGLVPVCAHGTSLFLLCLRCKEEVKIQPEDRL